MARRGNRESLDMFLGVVTQGSLDGKGNLDQWGLQDLVAHQGIQDLEVRQVFQAHL